MSEPCFLGSLLYTCIYMTKVNLKMFVWCPAWILDHVDASFLFFSTLFSALLQRSLKNYELGILLSALNSGTSQVKSSQKKIIQSALIASNIAQEFHTVLQCKSWRIWNNYDKEGWEVMLSTENFTPSRINITAVHVDIAAEIIKSKKECACI